MAPIVAGLDMPGNGGQSESQTVVNGTKFRFFGGRPSSERNVESESVVRR
jgi:hypothetical protein